MQHTTKQSNKKLSGHLQWYHWLVVIGSLALTLSAWQITSKQEKQKAQEQFNYQTQQIIELVKERMGKYEEALWAGVAALHAMPDKASRANWNSFAGTLKIESRYPGINGIGVIHYVKPEHLQEYLDWQRETLPDYKIYPSHNRAEYWPITYIEPQRTNAKAVGLDMAHENNRYTAATKTRDTGTAQITAPITLVQDAKQTPGFLFYVPWYETQRTPRTMESRRERFRGLVYAPFIMHKLMDGALSNSNRQVNFSIHDSETELYNELNPNSTDFDPNPVFKTEVSLDLYGRPWHFTIYSSKIFRNQTTSSQPMMILVGGLIIDVMLLVLFLVLANANKKAISYAALVTRDLKQSKHELENTHSRMSSALNAMMDGLVVINDTGIVLEVNSAALKMFGYSREQLLGHNVKILMPKDHAELHDIFLQRKTPIESNPIIGKQRDLNAKRSDGTIFPIKLSVTVTHIDKDMLYTGVIHDLSALNRSQQQLQKSEGLLQAALFKSMSPFIVADNKGNILEVNQACTNWLGYEKEELVKLRLADLIAPDSRDYAENACNKIIDGEVQASTHQCQYRHKNGEIKWGMVSATLVNSGTSDSSFIVLQINDVTQQKDLENDLEDKNKNLESTNNELNQFAYVASHDLKEPLRTLRTFSNYLIKDAEAKKWDRVAQDIYHVEDATERMTALINSLLEFSRAGNAELHTEPVSSTELIDRVISSLRAQIEDKRAKLVLEGEPLVFRGDASLLTQVLQNLISNAIKFCQKGEIPEVIVRVDKPKSTQYGEIHIIDRGLGIASDQLDNIFIAFKRLHGVGDYAGTGIGLAIVKKIVDRHGGCIHVESTPGEGSQFTVSLPLAQEVNTADQAAAVRV